MDTFPYETWEEAIAAAQEAGAGYFTFGPGGNTGTIALTLLGFLVMVATLVVGVMLEDRNLREHAKRLEFEVKNGG
jgi:hypothetical protein